MGLITLRKINTVTIVITVPFHSVRQSRITGPSKTLKCHVSHGNFCKVPNSFGDHVPNIENFLHLLR